MNITLLANHDIASNLALNLLLPKLKDHRITVYLSSRVGKVGAKPQALEALQSFEQALLHSLSEESDSHASTASRLQSFSALGKLIGRPIDTLNQINSPAGQSILAAGRPDLVVTIRYGVILQQPVIALPRHGVINLHSGPLPDYRGVMASFWGMLKGASELGTTLHYIDDSSIDTGRIISTTRLPVDRQRSYLWHVLNLYAGVCETIIKTIELLHVGEPVKCQPQPPVGTYHTFPTDADLGRFFKQGLKLFDSDVQSVLS